MEDKSSVVIFIDDEDQPVGQFSSPVNFELDSTKLADGEHVLKIISRDPSGKEGIRRIPFKVRNGPDISIEGIKDNEIIDGIIPLMVSAYGKGDQKVFLIEGSETPRSVPGWLWIIYLLFGGWAIYYIITQWVPGG